MKKILVASILCTAVFCGCSAKESSEISETSIPETSSVSVTASSAEDTETEAAAEKAAVTEPAEEEIILTPIPSKEPFEVMSCQIIENTAVDEENFSNKEVIKRAKEICFEKAHDRIEDHNDTVERGIYGIRVETAEDIVFSCGMALDFDGDGSEEYAVALNFRPTNPMGGSSLVLMDGSEYMIDIIDFGKTDMELILNSGVYFPMVTYSGPTWQFTNVYRFENDNPLKISPPEIGMGGPYSIIYKDNIFYRTAKYEQIYEPFILCGDGVFRQLGRKKITHDDFEAHVKNGGAYLDSLAENGETITEIYTYGYYNYELYGEGFRYDIYGNYFADNNTLLTEKVNCDGVHGELYFTDEVIYGDVWAVQPTRSRDYDIGGGYVCYTTGEAGNKILNVAKDNIITDSIETNGFDPNWQIHFYDMDTPPCFAVKKESWGINYRTYFVIDGKITEMNWTLDGERLDTVDYTMLQCRGEGNEFVSYSIPIWEDDRFVKRRFTFADGDHTNIVGYSEEIDGEIIKWWDTDSGTSSETANEIMHKVCGFWSDAYCGKTSYDGNERWLLLIEEEGFRTKDEMMNTLLEFCTLSAAEEVYSMLLENRYPDFEIIDGRIYLQDGPPNNYLPYYYVESAEEKDGVIIAKFFAYYSGQDIPYRICAPLYAEFVRDDGVWKISSLPKEKQPTP